MRSRAIVANQTNKQSNNCVAAVPQQSEHTVAVFEDDRKQRIGVGQFDLAGIADKRYAISEDLVEKNRREYQGNWVEDRHANFVTQHGQLVECDGQDAWSDDEGEEDACCSGVCVKLIEAVQTRFDALKQQCLALLRSVRAVRRDQGYVPNHALLLVMHAETQALLQIHVLGRVSFSPFDFTAVHLHPSEQRNGSVMGEIVSLHGAAVMHNMDQLLVDLAGRSNICLATAHYDAVTLGSIRLKLGSQQTLERLQAGVHGVGGMVNRRGVEAASSDEDDVLHHRSDLLQRALGQGPKKRAQPQRKKSTKAKASAAKARARRSATDTAAVPDEAAGSAQVAGMDAKIDHAIATSWSEALEADLGGIAHNPAAASSSSSARPAVEAVEQVKTPWADEKGHVFVMVPDPNKLGEFKKKHLGDLRDHRATL